MSECVTNQKQSSCGLCPGHVARVEPSPVRLNQTWKKAECRGLWPEHPSAARTDRGNGRENRIRGERPVINQIQADKAVPDSNHVRQTGREGKRILV